MTFALGMHEIDRPVRLTTGFFILWALVEAATIPLLRFLDLGPWYSKCAFALCVPFLASLALYCLVMFIHGVVHSGARGRLVGRTFLQVLFQALVLFGGLVLSGMYTETRATLLGACFAMWAAVYVKIKLGTGETY